MKVKRGVCNTCPVATSPTEHTEARHDHECEGSLYETDERTQNEHTSERGLTAQGTAMWAPASGSALVPYTLYRDLRLIV